MWVENYVFSLFCFEIFLEVNFYIFVVYIVILFNYLVILFLEFDFFFTGIFYSLVFF